jgi:lantibiotic leader peptide-processing serine protease
VPRLLRRAAALITVGGLAGAMLFAAPVAASGQAQTYLVVFKDLAVPAKLAKTVGDAGGTLVASYDKIGVAVVRSGTSTFAPKLRGNTSVASVAATAAFAARLASDSSTSTGSSPSVDTPATDSDSLSGLQWDMAQIRTPAAHVITGGSSTIVVGDIDTGLDYTHPDLAANVDDADSANCTSGAAVQGKVAAMDDNGHGTHTAGTIAAASNGIGIVGVAPNVKIAGIKAGNSDGFFFPEAVVCAFVWVGDHHINVTNNSYFADPWLFNCKNDPEQRAILTAEQRAIKYAQKNGDVVVAAAGNQADDLDHPTQDVTSPDDTTPVTRDVTNACLVSPVEIPGVVGASAVGPTLVKSFYSSYGKQGVDVTAPGGDTRAPDGTANGRVLSTWPASLFTTTCAASRRVIDVSGATYCYQQGTSMASPHVAGVAALIMSQHPDWKPDKVAATIRSTADPIACPADTSDLFHFPLATDNGAPQTCRGGANDNNFYGHGEVNALSAVNK